MISQGAECSPDDVRILLLWYLMIAKFSALLLNLVEQHDIESASEEDLQPVKQ